MIPYFVNRFLLLATLLLSPSSTVTTNKFPGAAAALEAGMDISEALRAQSSGVVYKNRNGTPTDAFKILKDYGYEWARCRIMVDPDGKYALFQDLEYVKRTALQVKKQGLKFLLNFHYSNWWADPGDQNIPGRWRGKSSKGLRLAVKSYSKNVVRQLCAQGTCPDAVLVGNEISRGMLWKKGKVPWKWNVQDPPSSWRRLVGLINGGTEGIRAAARLYGKEPLIGMHLDIGGSKGHTDRWIRTFLKLGGKCDVIALSYYPWWQGTFGDLKANIDNISKQFPSLRIWIAETAYYWERGYPPDQMPYPQTPDGQAAYLRDLRELLLQTKVDNIFYWGSHWIQDGKWFIAPEDWSDPTSRALFFPDGKATKAILALPGR